MTATEFFRGLLAALAVKDRTLLPASHAHIHRAFFRVLRDIRGPEIRDQLEIDDLIEIDYDPLYGQSRWFDRALSRAQRDHIISFPNPMYDTMQIKYDPATGKVVLDRLESRGVIERLADVFAAQLDLQEREQQASK